MSLLKKLGLALVDGLKLIPAIGPIVADLFPASSATAGTILGQVESTFDAILHAVTYAEAFGAALSLPGSQKIIAAAPLVEQAVLAEFKRRGWQISDDQQVAFKADCQTLAGVVADIMNRANGDAVKTVGL